MQHFALASGDFVPRYPTEALPLDPSISRAPSFGPIEKFLDPPQGRHYRHSHMRSRRTVRLYF